MSQPKLAIFHSPSSQYYTCYQYYVQPIDKNQIISLDEHEHKQYLDMSRTNLTILYLDVTKLRSYVQDLLINKLPLLL